MKRTLELAACLMLLATMAFADKWALVVDEQVSETWNYRPNFHPDVMRSVVEAPDTVAPRWRYKSGVWLPPKSQQEQENEEFDKKRGKLLRMSGISARQEMTKTFKYRMNGTLETGYPDPLQPMCTNSVGQALTLSEFMDYIQERDDEGASQPELNALKQQAKQVRQYLKSLKGD